MIPTIENLRARLGARMQEIPAREQFRLGVILSAMALSLLVLAICVYQVQAIPARIGGQIDGELDHRPWVRDLVVIDGRHVYLRGEIEPDSALESEIDIIRGIPGVREVTNLVEEIPRLSPHMLLWRLDDQLVAGGRMNGETQEAAVRIIQQSYPDARLRDSIKIDDRLGRPLWLDGFGQSLEKLTALERFELNGWRDQIEISGAAETDLERRQVGYAVPASLISGVNVVNRIKLQVDPDRPDITVVSDWSGSTISGSVPSATARERLAQSAQKAFHIPGAQASLDVDPGLQGESILNSLADLLPALADVSDMRLESSGDGFVVWGRVEDPKVLGSFLHQRNQLGLESSLQNEIRVSPAGKQATVTLFSDSRRAVVSGVLPTVATRSRLLSDIRQLLGVDTVVDLTSVEPNVRRSEWLAKWPQLLSQLPPTVVGVSVNDGSILLTGNVDSRETLDTVDSGLAMLFPDIERLNWLTASGEN